MSRVRTLFATIIPSAIAGGFLFASAFSHAESDRDGAPGFWPASSDAAQGSVLVAQADPQPPRYRGVPPIPPPPPSPPSPPTPPSPPSYSHSRHRNHGMSVSIHDGKVEIDGIAELVESSLSSALAALEHLDLDNMNVPPDVRDKLRGRIEATRARINNRLARIKSMDVDKLGPELERMGDEIERDMESIDRDLEKLGEKIGKGIADKFGKNFAKNFGPNSPARATSGQDGDNDDDRDDESDDDHDAAPAEAMQQDLPSSATFKGVVLDPEQRDRLAKLRRESEEKIRSAQGELDRMSSQLERALSSGSANEDDIARQIDSISAQEATIRKARILSWVRARSVLRDDQRQQVEAALKKSH